VARIDGDLAVLSRRPRRARAEMVTRMMARGPVVKVTVFSCHSPIKGWTETDPGLPTLLTQRRRSAMETVAPASWKSRSKVDANCVS